ncbi:MAG: hypothetical protein ACI4PE_05730 [Bacilli bacterium]
MLEKYKDSQKIFYDYFMLSFDKNRISHAYLIETNNVSYAYCLAIDLAKFLLCNGKYNEKICNLIDSNNYANFKVIGESSDVKKDDIVTLKREFSLKSSDDNRQVYIIRDVSSMNKSSLNSLLKFLEEPEGDVIAILLCNSASSVLSTISSRCQIVSLVNDDNNYMNIFARLYEKLDVSDDFNDFAFLYGNKFYDFYLKFEENGFYVLGDKEIYNFSNCLYELLVFGLYMYFDVVSIMFDRDARVLPLEFNLENVVKNNEISDIIRKIDVINKFIYNFKFNVNVNLFLDNFIISLGDDI